MNTPEQEAVTERSSAESYPAIARLRKYLSSGKDAEQAFRKWRLDPVTRCFLGALSEYADAPDPSSAGASGTERILVQYGLASGIGFALKLLSQPYRVYPEAFGGSGQAVADSLLDKAYTDGPDDTIDDM